jgi:hypothetical protein
MAWIEEYRRKDGGRSYKVRWRQDGARDGFRHAETFGVGRDEQNRARAEGFAKMVEAAGENWPDGWVKGQGFLRPREDADPLTPPPMSSTSARSTSARSSTAHRGSASDTWPRCGS